MPSDVLITPASSKIEFTDGANATKTLKITGTSFSFDSDLGIGIASPVSKFVVNGGSVNTSTYTSSEARIADGSLHLMKTSAGGIFESVRAMNADTTAGTTVRFIAASTSDPFNNTNGGKVFIDAIRTSTNMDLAFSLNDVAGAAPVERVRFTGSGNIGVGTTIPTARIDTLGVRLGRNFSLADRATVRLDANGTAYPSDILFGHTSVANQDGWNGVYWSLSSRASANSNRFHFYRGSGNPAPNNSEAVIMSFDPNLNVGIGFEAPANRLAIAGSVSIGSGYNTAGPTNGLIVQGNFGAGTTSPDLKVHIDAANAYPASSGTTPNGYLILRAKTAGGTHGMYLGVGNASPFGSWIQCSDSGNLATNYPLLLNPNGGNVGIGLTNPIYKFHVSGEIYSSTYINAATYFQTNTGQIKSDTSFAFLTTGNAAQSASIKGILLGTSYDATPNANEIRTTNNTSLFLNARGTGDIQFQTADSLKMMLLNNGNVGINTATPAYRLDVNGTFNASGTSTLAAVSISGTINSSATEAIRVNNNNGFISFYNSAGNSRTGYLQGNSGNDILLASENGAVIRFAIGGSERVRIDTSGRLGIGTTSALGELDVYDNANAGAISYYRNVNSGSSAYIALLLGNDQGSNKLVMFTNSSTRTADGGAGNSTIRTDSGNLLLGAGGSQHILTTTGNVGIGTTSPATRLDIHGSVSLRGTTVLTTNFDLNAGNAADIYANIRVLRGASLNDGMYIGYAGAGGPLRFFSNSGTTEFMTIATTGNVGIGNTNPSYKLDVNGSFRTATSNLTIFNDNIYVSPTNSNTLNSGYGANSITDMWINFRGYADGQTQFRNFNIGDGKGTNIAWFDGTNKRMSLNNGQAASYTLHVNGTGYFNSTLQVNSNLTLSGGGDVIINDSDGTGFFASFMDSGVGYIRIDDGGTANGSLNINSGTLFVGPSSGNVGVGNTSPSNKLHVNGSASIGSGYNTAAPTNGLIVQGNVGIGISSPTNKFHVVGSHVSSNGMIRFEASDYSIISLKAPSTGDGSAGYWGFRTQDTSNNDLMFYGYRYTPAFSGFWIDPDFGGVVTKGFFVKRSDGNVGIGTNTQNAKLHINSTASGATLIRADGTNGTLFSVVDDLSDSLMSVNNSAGLPVLEVFADDRIIAGQYGANDFVLVNNKLGLGTNNPNKQLTFAQTNDDAIQIRRITVGSGGPAAGTGISWTWTSATTDNETWAAIRAIFPGNGDTHLTFSNRPANGSTTERMRIQNDGSVGIGTATPSWLLTVYAASAPQFALSNATRSFVLTNNAADGLLSFNYGGANRLQFNTTNQWFNTGNFGVNISTPTGKLHVVDTSLYAPSLIWDTACATIIRSENGQLAFGSDSASPYSIWMQVRTTSNGSRPLTLNPLGGGVGIGTTTPGAVLQINGGTPTSATGGIQFGDDTGARLYRSASGVIFASGDLRSSTAVLAGTYLQTLGNLIYPQTYGSTLRLEVSNAANNAWIDGLTIAPGGNVTVAGTLTESSSIRYKENIKTVSAPILPKLEAIRTVTYNKKDNPNNTEYGIIAEELNELFPELVNKNDNGEVESVNYSRLTVLLIKAVKELKEEVDRLKNK